ncbi:MAG: nucleotidyltransferase family protein [Ignavibacteriae bacterium]|nr:nucleotidyltransferase family protein [Ignavibacteriota bacterium]
MNKITGIIIAAGLSSRMGKFKPLLRYDGKTFLENIIDKLLLICDKIIIVTGHNADLIVNLVNQNYKNQKVVCVNNSDYQSGMFSSLKVGVKSCINSNWILFHQVDQPNLPLKFYKEFTDKIEIKCDWIQPIFEGRKGHPILFNNNVIEKILDANNNSNLREISKSKEINQYFWECSFNEILTDLDTPNDFKKFTEGKNEIF